MTAKGEPVTTIGLLHPGAMGAEVGARLVEAGGVDVIWSRAGRSADSERRAVKAGLTPVATVGDLTAEADLILSVCPPDAAQTLARAVAALGFDGLYIDANAVSPATARAIGESFDRFVDGGIIGPPPTAAGMTRLYLAGEEAASAAAIFEPTAIEARVVDGGAGGASAVKMCFASWTKGNSALLLAVRALAEAEGVSESLLGEWATSMPELTARSEVTAGNVAPKAWRFVGEMEEIAASFAAVGLPNDFHLAAADVYRRLGPLKVHEGRADLETVLGLLLDGAADD